MQIFICPECGHKSFFDPWVESANCPRCKYIPPPPGTQPSGFVDQFGEKIPIAREQITQIYQNTKRGAAARSYIILVRRDDHLYTFGEDAVRVIKVLGTETQVNEIFDDVSPPTARIPFESRYDPMARVEAAGHPIGMAPNGILTCPRCGRQNITKDIFFPSYQCPECDYVPPERDQLVVSFLRKGIQSAKEGERDEARYALEQVLFHEGTADQRAEAHFWLAEITPNLYEKRERLKRALDQKPTGSLLVGSIQATLKQVEDILEGKTDADQISQNLPEDPSEESVRAVRHSCPRCGSKMHFSPDESSLICLSCQHHQVPGQQHDIVHEQSFTEAMAALRGHARPVNTRSLECSACGAVFLLAPATLSQACPYCASAYTVEGEISQALIPPTGLIPFEISQTEAQTHLDAWFRSKGISFSRKIESPLGIYLPLWTFDLGGLLSWSKPGLLFSQSRTQSKFFDDILVSAVSKIPSDLLEEKGDFDFGKTTPFSPDYLADWPAETYDIALSDASLISRQKAIDSFRAMHQLGKNVQLRTSALQIESFKLILVPMWITHFDHQSKQYRVIINGQSGVVRIQRLNNDQNGY
jgi:hypothetical protein